MSKILVVDDEQGVCFAFEKFLKAQGHEPLICSNAEIALAQIPAHQPDLVITDIRLPGMDGLELLARLKEDRPDIPVIVVTAYSTMKTAVQAMKSGAYEYLVKPIDLDEAKIHIERALESSSRQSELRMLRGELSRLYGREPETASGPAEPPVIIGKSAAMQDVFKKIGSVSVSDVTVLITGESGTGKELVARAIHTSSARRLGPFEPINCASLPDTLLESELYGHEEGAFTGASHSRAGKFEIASGGTVFLDEIGDISPAAQVKLLRFLEDKEFTRLGGNKHLTTDVRIISATNSNLAQKMRTGEFREDLYYRLKVFSIHLPALRDRVEDIPLLAAHFLGRDAKIDRMALAAIRACRWPGNVRELRNAIEHAMVLARGKTIMPEHLPREVTGTQAEARQWDSDATPEGLAVALFDEKSRDPSLEGAVFDDIMDMWERPILERAMNLYLGNQMQVARLLGMHRSTLRKKLLKYGLA